MKAYAKINIGLRIIKKRDDGFHDIETIFYPVSLSDEINVSATPTTKDFNSVIIKTNRSYISADRTNTCYKIIEQFFKEFQIRDKFKIEILIKKSIPVGGGLGGGSSDAASVLKYLVKYFNIDVSSNKEKVMNIALTVGSDIPFFLICKPCYATGKGEILKVLPYFKIKNKILLVTPNLHISSKWAYESLNIQHEYTSAPALAGVKNIDVNDMEKFVNDFEKPVFEKYTEIKKVKSEMIRRGALFSSLSGSGATVYGIFPETSRKQIYDTYYFFKSKQFFVYIS